jgi:hypothetical protein
MNESSRTDRRRVNAPVDPRLIFLHRAHSRLILVENGLMSLDEAYSGLIYNVPCDCGHRRTA